MRAKWKRSRPIRLRYTGEADRPDHRLRRSGHHSHRAGPGRARIHQHDRGPRHSERSPARGHAVHQRPAEEEGHWRAGELLLSALRPGNHGQDARRGQDSSASAMRPRPACPSASTTWSSRTARRTLVKDAEKQVVTVQQQYLDGAITNGERYNKVIEIWSAITEKVADEMFGEMQQRDKEGEHQSDLRHGRLRRSRIETADSPALRHARIDGQAVRRNHRDADHGELP